MNRTSKAIAAFAVFGSLLAVNQAQAAKWGTAGCGVGALIFEDKPGKIQILSATTNQYFGQTFSITSGTSACEESRDDMAALFIEINREALKNDVSRGGGETVATLSQIMGCSDASYFGTKLQKNYSDIFGLEEKTGQQTRDLMKDLMRSDNVLGQCDILS